MKPEPNRTQPRRDIYIKWRNMINRCYKPTASDYHLYGGEGVTVCKEWRESFEKFLSWAIGSGYAKGLILDRRENSIGYTPDNCRFVSWSESNKNRRMTPKFLASIHRTRASESYINAVKNRKPSRKTA